MKIRAHETFNIRKGWIHKGIKNISLYPRLFTDKDINPCDILGIGTNMVKSLRYWLLTVGVMEEVQDGNQKLQMPTNLGLLINRYDPYYEEDGTNWILHYMLAKNEDFATSWFWFFNCFKVTTFDKQTFIKELKDYLYTEYSYEASEKMLADDFDCLIKTYYSKDKDKSPEDVNECPLTDLHLIEAVDNIDYKKNTPNKDSIHPLIILSVIYDNANSNEILITDLLNSKNNIGKIFNLDRSSCFYYLEQLQKRGYLNIERTAGLDLIRLNSRLTLLETIELYYKEINGVNLQ